jgi:DNA-binding response OmpR family regulator
MIRILLVEDDPDMLDLTAYVLRRERFVVIEASDGPAALRRWRIDRPDVVVLDIGLPSLDGFEVLRQIRDEGDTPVLIVTARKDAQDILRAFNLGTDDFIPKPFEFRELIVRIRAILRRVKAAPAEEAEPRVQLDGLALDPQSSEVIWRERSVRLTPTEFRILYLLATNQGRIVPASRMHTYVWGSQGGDANALRSHISHLRRKLEGAGESPGTIECVPAVGYVFRPTAAAIINGSPALTPAPDRPVPPSATVIGGPKPAGAAARAPSS